MLKVFRRAFVNDIVIGTLLVLLFSVGFSLFMFVLSWPNIRDNHGVSLLEYFRLVF